MVALVEVPGALLPAFYDPADGGWRCPRCEEVLAAFRRDGDLPRTGDRCLRCQSHVRHVLRWRWQRVNWLGMTGVAAVALLAVQVVGPLILRLR
jgi:hypothetical protein